MNLKDFETVNVHQPQGGRRRRLRNVSNPTFAEAVFGVICVIGVFAVLGLLYSFK